jgi:hypothetical protein
MRLLEALLERRRVVECGLEEVSRNKDLLLLEMSPAD